MALVGAAFGLGFLFGPSMGGLLTKINLLDHLSHLARFGINPFSVPAIVATALDIINFFWILVLFKETFPKEKTCST